MGFEGVPSCPHSPALLCLQPEEVAQEAAEEPLIEPLMAPEGESYEETPQVRGQQDGGRGIPKTEVIPPGRWVGSPQHDKVGLGGLP